VDASFPTAFSRRVPERRALGANSAPNREQVEGAAREAVDARHRHHVAGYEALEHLEKLAPVVVRPRRRRA
jgi:hypothetical protein